MPMVDDLGRINIDTFKRTHPVVGSMLSAFFLMTCLLLYFGTVIETWPNSETLEALALKAIDIILGAHAVDGTDVAETCKLSIRSLTYKRALMFGLQQWRLGYPQRLQNGLLLKSGSI